MMMMMAFQGGCKLYQMPCHTILYSFSKTFSLHLAKTFHIYIYLDLHDDDDDGNDIPDVNEELQKGVGDDNRNKMDLLQSQAQI